MESLRVLFISPYLPSLIRARSYNFINALARRGHRITLLALEPPGEDASGLDSLRAWCQCVQTVRLRRWRTLWNGLCALPGQTPFQAAYSWSPEMTALIRQTQAKGSFDVIHVEHLRGAELSQAVNGIPTVFDSVDSITLLFEQVRNSGPTWRSRLMARLDLERTRYYEGRLLEHYPRVLVTSPLDRDALAELSTAQDAASRLAIVPVGVDMDYFIPMDARRDPATLIFSGKMSYHSNIAAALDLATQVMPHVWRQLPDTQLTIVGKDPPVELLTLASDPRITVTGTVPDMRPYLARATVAVSPMRYGAGMQFKVIEAMAMATPVVTTSQTTTALQAQPGRDLLVADIPQAIAETVIALLTDEALRLRIGQAGRRYVETYHDWNAIAEKLEAIYWDVIAEARQGQNNRTGS